MTAPISSARSRTSVHEPESFAAADLASHLRLLLLRPLQSHCRGHHRHSRNKGCYTVQARACPGPAQAASEGRRQPRHPRACPPAAASPLIDSATYPYKISSGEIIQQPGRQPTRSKNDLLSSVNTRTCASAAAPRTGMSKYGNPVDTSGIIIGCCSCCASKPNDSSEVSTSFEHPGTRSSSWLRGRL